MVAVAVLQPQHAVAMCNDVYAPAWWCIYLAHPAVFWASLPVVAYGGGAPPLGWGSLHQRSTLPKFQHLENIVYTIWADAQKTAGWWA